MIEEEKIVEFVEDENGEEEEDEDAMNNYNSLGIDIEDTHNATSILTTDFDTSEAIYNLYSSRGPLVLLMNLH